MQSTQRRLNRMVEIRLAAVDLADQGRQQTDAQDNAVVMKWINDQQRLIRDRLERIGNQVDWNDPSHTSHPTWLRGHRWNRVLQQLNQAEIQLLNQPIITGQEPIFVQIGRYKMYWNDPVITSLSEIRHIISRLEVNEAILNRQ